MKKYLIALAFVLVPMLADAAPVVFTVACGSSAAVGTPSDFLKLAAAARVFRNDACAARDQLRQLFRV
jgi:fructoselysine-6-P-deglycase FrlB-like protein